MKKFVKWLILSSLILAIILCGTGVSAASLTLASVFTNNMVLQRQMTDVVWGTSTPGAQVTVSFLGQNVTATTGADGKWQAYLAPMAANSVPSTMTVTGDGLTITRTNIQVGEVWIGSGQSNMTLSLGTSTGGDAAIAESGNYNICIFRAPSDTWYQSNPSNCANAYAVLYYFGRELARNLPGVPIGLIEAAVNGSKVSSWTHYNGYSGLNFDLKIQPWLPFVFRGVNWYQGEGDSSSMTYQDDLTGLIAEWRGIWNYPNMPFQIVQLAWKPDPRIQNQQFWTYMSVPNTALAVAVDLDPTGRSVHTYMKEPVGYRLALCARHNVYGESSLIYRGPMPNQALSHVTGNKVVIYFDCADGGLSTGGPYVPGGAPYPFKVAGSDKSYHDATATIAGNTVEVVSTLESAPVYVRYTWDYAQGNLYNGAGLPAPVFEMAVSPGGGDTQAPTAPTNLAATAVSSSQINLSWTASTDNVGVTGYRIFRGGVQVGTSSTTSYSDTGLAPNTTYSYYVKAYDAAGNISPQGNTAQATTLVAASPSPPPSASPGVTPSAPPPSPSPSPSPSTSPGGTVTHVADIWSCDASGNVKTHFYNETVYWRTKMVDAGGNPVPGVSVTTQLLKPNGTTQATYTQTTGADGAAIFSQGLNKAAAQGTWTINVTNAAKSGWTYDAGANVTSQTTFQIP